MKLKDCWVQMGSVVSCVKLCFHLFLFCFVLFCFFFCSVSSAKSLRKLFMLIFPTFPSKINGPTLKNPSPHKKINLFEYSKTGYPLKFNWNILSCTTSTTSALWQRTATEALCPFKTAIYRQTDIYV